MKFPEQVTGIAALDSAIDGGIRSRPRRVVKSEARNGPVSITKVRVRKPWTVEDFGFLQDTADWTLRRVAQKLGRTASSVKFKRQALARGWVPTRQFWDPAEDDVILAAGAYIKAKSLMEQLPGRTEGAISHRRTWLGVETVGFHEKRPEVIGARPLLAKTCRGCGLLLQADWFEFRPSERKWKSQCRKCNSAKIMSLQKNRDRTASPIQRQHKSRQDQQSRKRLQTITLAYAENKGQEYTQVDHVILADPDLTRVQKALRLRRTYNATMRACSKFGYPSHKGLGDPDHDQWIIDNPNAARFAGDSEVAS